MAIFRRGNMWTSWSQPGTRPGMYVVSTNGSINTSSQLVMGKGAAREAYLLFPQLRERLAIEITRLRKEALFGKNHTAAVGTAKEAIPYHFAVVPSSQATPGILVGALQVKYRWFETANYDLVSASISKMVDDIKNRPYMNGVQIHMNFPAIGNGELSRGNILPLVQALPDQFHVWEFGK